ncbi:PP2C family protein-serine/threonine phosphatase [Dactylosporangium sp. CS-047395]|uniref:PP2C family protein-serine/threonine phosphatase n=1 Tax=Dactylosporangium sp. CS-047395 TaxID=3239936 RepID=UPI003D91FECD
MYSTGVPTSIGDTGAGADHWWLPMQLAAEIIWTQLPPLTFATDRATVAAILEPAYEVGGDAFDYAANGDALHVALFDAVGHGIEASALTALTLSAYRNARRSAWTSATPTARSTNGSTRNTPAVS